MARRPPAPPTSTSAWRPGDSRALDFMQLLTVLLVAVLVAGAVLGVRWMLGLEPGPAPQTGVPASGAGPSDTAAPPPAEPPPLLPAFEPTPSPQATGTAGQPPPPAAPTEAPPLEEGAPDLTT